MTTQLTLPKQWTPVGYATAAVAHYLIKDAGKEISVQISDTAKEPSVQAPTTG